jgi:hypothetical protein
MIRVKSFKAVVFYYSMSLIFLSPQKAMKRLF